MRILSILIAVLITLVGSVAAQLAESYQIEADRLTGLASNVAVDIIGHRTNPMQVWLATGRGVSYSPDTGQTWFFNNSTNGLPADNLSAICSLNGRIWVASNHNAMVEAQLTTLSDGLSYSDDDGETWTTLDFGSDGLNIKYVIGGDRTIYDLTAHHDIGFLNNRTNDTTDWLFAAAFAGSLLASQDNGINWRRIYASPSDSIQYSYTTEAPSLRNRYFSCVVDTSHGDSVFLWAGTAAGIFQYVFASPRDKLYSRWINDIVFCDTCSAEGGSRLYVAGNDGLSLATATSGTVSSRFALDGLPTNGTKIASVFSIGDRLLAGTVNPNTGGSTGMVVSTDGGESFSQVTAQPWTLGVNRVVSDFVVMDGRVYAALEGAGLYVSTDSGWAWAQVPINSHFTPAALNTVNALAVLEDTLLVGTDSGLVMLALDGDGNIVSALHEDFPDTDTTSTSIIRVRPQRFESDTLAGTYDSTVIWTVNRPRTETGRPIVGRRDVAGDWGYLRRGIEIYDVNFFGDTVFAVGENSIWFSPRGEEPTNFFSAREMRDTVEVDNLDGDTVTVMEVRADTVIFGCSNGIAISQDRGETFTIYRANKDTLSADFVVNHSYITSLGGIAGDFIPSLAVQYQTSGPARIWAGCRPATYGDIGISYGEYDSAGDMIWQTVYEDDYAWNFEFMDEKVLAASNIGLLMVDSTLTTTGNRLDSLDTEWDTVTLTDTASGEVLVAAGTAAYGVALIDSNLWVGTDDGTVRISRADLGNQKLYLRVDSTTSADDVYAFPVPFRPGLEQVVDFHFVMPTAGYVSLKVYDFAMNLVATPIDNVYYPAGIYPPAHSQGASWDGRNDNGDLVAVGVYYFKVETDSGEVHWGKLAVIP